MNTEMAYLLDELNDWNEDNPIKVRDLKRMIEKCFIKAGKDQEEIENSMSEIGHDM